MVKTIQIVDIEAEIHKYHFNGDINLYREYLTHFGTYSLYYLTYLLAIQISANFFYKGKEIVEIDAIDIRRQGIKKKLNIEMYWADKESIDEALKNDYHFFKKFFSQIIFKNNDNHTHQDMNAIMSILKTLIMNELSVIAQECQDEKIKKRLIDFNFSDNEKDFYTVFHTYYIYNVSNRHRLSMLGDFTEEKLADIQKQIIMFC